MTTVDVALRGAEPNEGGYRALLPSAGEVHVVRSDLVAHAGQAAGVSHVDAAALTATLTPLLTVAHLSDLHICDAQSPGRVEFLDRFADPDSPLREYLDEVGTYRAQEILTAQVTASMVRAVNAVAGGPLGGAPVELAICTGDNTDNAQANELSWYLSLLDGGTVRADSGDLTRYEGVCDDSIAEETHFDDRHWHPSTALPDLPRSVYGFPSAPGLLDTVRRPFDSPGLSMPWLAVHGNHDQMLQGTLPAVGALATAVTGSLKPIAVAPEWTTEEVLAVLGGLEQCDPAAIRRLAEARTRTVTADPGRRIFVRQEFVDAHFHPSAQPFGHGFGQRNQLDGSAYYRFDRGRVTFLVMDTVDEYGGWQGSLDLEQAAWVVAELDAADRDGRYVVLASHHPLHTMVNDRHDGGHPRMLGTEFAVLLAGHPSLVLWLNGHTHHTAVVPHPGYWEVTAPSLMDWPQQGRIVELLAGDGRLAIAATMLDHLGEAPWSGDVETVDGMAGLSREMAANDWQWRLKPLEEHPRNGTAGDRNVILLLDDPFA